MCDWHFLGLCFYKASSSSAPIFNFSSFISGVALLTIVYTISDFRYKFRIAVAPFNLRIITFYLVPILGVGTLVSELWVAQEWLSPSGNFSQAIWQSIFAIFFIGIITAWLWFAFLAPPKFNQRNYKNFSRSLYRAIEKGDETELKIIADELQASIGNIIKLGNNPDFSKKDHVFAEDHISLYARDMISLLANKNFCSILADSSPRTAIAFFSQLSQHEVIHSYCFSTFSSNLSLAFINNTNSLLYQEDDGFESGLLGNIKSLSNEMFGNFQLIIQLENFHRSPLSHHFLAYKSWDAVRFEKYIDCLLISFNAFIKQKYWNGRSHEFTQFFGTLSPIDPMHMFYNLDELVSYNSEDYKKFETIINFIDNMIKAIDSIESAPNSYSFWEDNRLRGSDIYDTIADLMHQCIYVAGSVKGTKVEIWSIQHNMVWSSFVDNFAEKRKARDIIMFKTRRLAYKDFRELEKYPNYRTIKTLGFYLNILGVKYSNRKIRRKNEWVLQKVMIDWLRKNFYKLYIETPKVAECALKGGITFNLEQCQLIKTYAGMIQNEGTQHRLKVHKKQSKFYY